MSVACHILLTNYRGFLVNVKARLVKNESVRSGYVRQAIQNGWSRSVVEMQVENL